MKVCLLFTRVGVLPKCGIVTHTQTPYRVLGANTLFLLCSRAGGSLVRTVPERRWVQADTDNIRNLE